MQYYVDPRGNDAHAGTSPQLDSPDQAGPFATLTRARDAAREHHRQHPEQQVRIVLSSGQHRLTRTLVLGLDDAQTTWRAAEGARPIVTSNAPITGWRKLTDEPDYLAPEARGNVWVAPVPEGTGPVRTLYRNSRLLTRARSGDIAREKLPEDVLAQGKPFDVFAYPEGALQDWPDVSDAQVVLIPQHTWTMNVLPLARVDAARRLAYTAAPGTYPLNPNHFSSNTWVENTLAVMHQPGTWVYHHDEQLIYYWPEDGADPGEAIAAATLTELVRVEGQINLEGPKDEPVRGLRFENLTFTGGARYPWHGQTGKGLQHDWDRHDEPTALLRLRGAEGCAVRGCAFVESESGGLRMDLHARDNTVEGCLFANLGGTGVTLAGYGLGTKNVNRNNRVRNCHIHHVGQTYWHSPGVFIWQSEGNDVSHNHVHHTPYTGIVCSGRTGFGHRPEAECAGTIRWSEVPDEYARGSHGAWHKPELWREDWLKREPLMHSRNNRIAYNDIHHVMQLLGDGNGVYISGAGGGNQVLRNFVHDCPSGSMAEGLRCDDDQHDTLIEGNVVVRLGGMATGITIKGVNDVVNNILARPVTERTARGMLSLEVGPLHGSRIERNVIVTEKPGQGFCWQSRLGCHGTGPDPLLRDAQTDHNLYWSSDDPARAAAHLEAERAHGVETQSVAADPLFIDADQDDWRFAQGSPALALGIEPVDVRETGVAAEGWQPPEAGW